MNTKTLAFVSAIAMAMVAQADRVKYVVAGPTAVTGARADKSVAVFNEDGVFTVKDAGTIEVLMVGGGGGGGAIGNLGSNDRAGGGGGGGVIYRQDYAITPGEYHVTVGAGGAVGANGGDSSIAELGLVAYGGGAGADLSPQDWSTNGKRGHDGGSGGGATTCNETPYEGGSPVDGQGCQGGSSTHVYGAGGGGGAMSPGGSSEGTSPGAGGAGMECAVLQAGEFYGGGGAGFRTGRTTSGGIGGGGSVLSGVRYPGEDGRGGGGAGGTAGGKGIVIIAWASVLDREITPGSDFGIVGSEEILADGGDVVLRFTADGTLSVTGSGYVELLAVGGGGGGGALSGDLGVSGGGAGGLVHFASLPVEPGTYDVKIGAGGEVGENGGSTSVFGITAHGGGHGSVAGSAPGAGGSGGGASHEAKNDGSVTNSAGAAMTLYGNIGHAGGWSSHQYAAGGGGGAGAEGGHTIGTDPSAGGSGLPFSIVGHEVYYAGGGAALRPIYGRSASGGIGGGGKTENGVPSPGEDGLGGGGAGNAKGGSGVLIVRYTPGSEFWKRAFDGATGGVVEKRKGYYIHTFSEDGYFTVPCNAEVEVLLVGGGGGGGAVSASNNQAGGGGGGGGGVIATNVFLAAGSHRIEIGAGGEIGLDGCDTKAFDLIAYGGGAGQAAEGVGSPGSRATGGGATKVSAAGTDMTPYPGGHAMYNAIDVKGFDGGSCTHVHFTGGGGGAGGAGAVGSWNSEKKVALGGVGFESDISGEPVSYGAGGNGQVNGLVKTPGVDGLGSGGSGNAKGGRGIVIVRYQKQKKGLALILR